MRVVVVGAGPVGLFCGLSLARRGHVVRIVDRDPPPPAAGVWPRSSVMQFHHPHFFRPIVRRVLLDHLPDMWDAIMDSGGIPARADGLPEEITGLHCRRSTFERAMWTAAARDTKLMWCTGFAQRVVLQDGRAIGVVVNGETVDADVVVVATGRASRLGDEFRAPAVGGLCGFGYITRMYRACDGVEPPSSPLPMISRYRGYDAYVFPQDQRTFSTLIAAPAADAALATLRHTRRWDSAVRIIPQLAPWTDPARFEPITEVLAGGLLTNTYRGQFDADGNVALAGLFFVGDAVSTTNPALGRGVSLGLLQATELVDLLGDTQCDYAEVARHFELWCMDHIWPWFEDQVYVDVSLLARFAGAAINSDGRIPSDVMCAAADVDPSLQPVIGPYLTMSALPASLRAVEPRVQGLLRNGWKPGFAEGPGRNELVEHIESMHPAAESQTLQPA